MKETNKSLILPMTQVGLRQPESGFDIMNRGSSSLFPPIKGDKDSKIQIEIDPRIAILTAQVEDFRAQVSEPLTHITHHLSQGLCD